MSRTAIVCVLCLIVAGCTAPTAHTQSPSAETNDSTATTRVGAEGGDDISVSGGTLPVEHERVFARVTNLLGVNVSPPTVIVVRSSAEIRNDTDATADRGDGSAVRSFPGVMGIGREAAGESDQGTDEEGSDDEGVSVAAYTPSAHSVVLNERMIASGRERLLERTLAHEYVHNVQFRQSAFERTQSELGLRYSYSRDRYLTYVSVVEGTAVYLADAYDSRFLPGDSATITSGERYRSAPPAVKYAISQYYFGSRYVAHRFDAPENVSSIYDDPPRTTEQLLHNDTDGSEEPRSLSVQVRPGENRTVGRTNTNGELFTRIALGSELDASRAAAAASGWGSDRLVPVVGEHRSFVWATRWDAPGEADEFESSLEAYLASRANQSGNAWRDDALSFRTVRVSDETVVLLAGNETFVRTANASGANESVSVSAT